MFAVWKTIQVFIHIFEFMLNFFYSSISKLIFTLLLYHFSSRDSIAAHFRTHFAAEKNRENTTPIKKKKNIKVEAQTCLECGVISKSKLLLDKHVLAAHGIQIPQQCQVCHETLPDPKALVEHKRQIHSNDICYICAKSYLSLSDLNLHISRMHPEMANLGQDHENAKHKPIKLLSRYGY